ncbi:MAG: hypothetical protein ACYTEL_13240 [Planctomycetota bacterium]|jgi:hypothetical protein
MATKKYKSKFLTFHQARRITRKLGLKSRREWEKLCRSKDRPKDIPACPHLTYKEYGWTDYADFLDYEPQQRFLPFNQARKFVRSLGFETTGKWAQYCASGKRPKTIPSDPKAVYKGQYKGLRDWIGLPEKRFLPFAKARKYVRSNKGLTGTNWWIWCKTHRPSNIPVRPDVIYKDEGWKGWKDWFGDKKRFLPYKEARALARTLGITGTQEWHLLSKQGKRPRTIPACPHSYYKEFVSYPDFFGYRRRWKARKNRG